MTNAADVEDSSNASRVRHLLQSRLPILQWLPSYQINWLRHDVLAGLALAAYSIPEALVNASLAGMPPQHGLYCFLIAGIAYSLFTTSRHAAVAATSAVSIMVGSTLGSMGIGDPAHYAKLAAATAMLVGVISFFAWLLRLSDIVGFISETILSGFKVGAALVIASSQLPKFLGIQEGYGNFFERIFQVLQNLGHVNLAVLVVGVGALILLLVGSRVISNGVVSLVVVTLSIIVMSLTSLSEFGVKVTGDIPVGFPVFGFPRLSFADIEEIVPVAFGCFLLAYVEGISMMRTFALKYRYKIDSGQEFLAAGAANLAVGLGQGFPGAVGLSQSTVNEHAGGRTRTPLSMIFACAMCGVVLLFFTGLFRNLPQPVLAAMILVAAKSLVNIPELKHLARVSKREFIVALVTLVSVLFFGILKGVLLAVVFSLVMLVHRVAHPVVSVLGRIPGTNEFGGTDRHPENETIPGVLACRAEGDLLYFNVENIFNDILDRVRSSDSPIELVVLDLSTSNHVDLAGARMVHHLHHELSSEGIYLILVGAHGDVRDLLRLDGLEKLVGRIDRHLTLEMVMNRKKAESGSSED
jgi:high affinity sulfate transporter 1